jgi:hypothetical protein
MPWKYQEGCLLFIWDIPEGGLVCEVMSPVLDPTAAAAHSDNLL